jgi:hypothetical protein
LRRGGLLASVTEITFVVFRGIANETLGFDTPPPVYQRRLVTDFFSIFCRSRNFSHHTLAFDAEYSVFVVAFRVQQREVVGHQHGAGRL